MTITQSQREQFWEDPDITNQPNQSIMNRSELINNYAYQIMEGMDMKTMECFVIDCLTDNLNSYTDEELIAEVTEYNSELLEEN